ncbi:probable long-chain-alcohol O-fatty-acyltransferase 5 [Tanacetum coccineum]
MESLIKNFIINTSIITTSLTYSYYIPSKLRKGIYRFISLIPILIIFTLLPLRCTAVFTTAVTFSFITWLTNFKLIRFAFDLDHSPYNPSYSLLKFIIITSLPVKSISNDPSSKQYAESRFSRNLGLGFKIVVFAIIVQIVLTYNGSIYPNIVSLMYGCLLYLIIDIVTAVINAIIRPLTGFELEPSSNHPYLATSLQNFWSRWNLMVTNTLRHTVYKPVTLVFNSYAWAPLVGVLVSFVVSGLMHELFVYVLAREAPTWEMTWFFVIHGVFVVVEMIVKRVVVDGGSWRLPGVVGRVGTVAFVAGTGVWLFMPPLVRRRLDVKIFEEYILVVKFIKDKLFGH